MSFKVKLRTKNHSASELRAELSKIRTRRPVVVRLGSRTPITEIFPKSHGSAIEINSIEGITNSRDKVLMKRIFDQAEVRSAAWQQMSPVMIWDVFPAIIKHKGSHGGDGIFLINNPEELNSWKESHPRLNQYIIEEYKNFTKEYRLHVDANGCFYTCRKMLKSDATDRWHRHDSNSVWMVEENPLFERPSNWDSIVAECVKALNAVGLTIGACDVKVQTEKGKRSGVTPDFIIMEINSAPSMGQITTQKYVEKISQLVSDDTI